MASFLGFCNYYWDLVPALAHVSDALYRDSRDKNIESTEALSETFDNLKRSLLERPVVRIPDPH